MHVLTSTPGSSLKLHACVGAYLKWVSKSARSSKDVRQLWPPWISKWNSRMSDSSDLHKWAPRTSMQWFWPPQVSKIISNYVQQLQPPCSKQYLNDVNDCNCHKSTSRSQRMSNDSNLHKLSSGTLRMWRLWPPWVNKRNLKDVQQLWSPQVSMQAGDIWWLWPSTIKADTHYCTT